jgi:hypothetical protein
MKKSIIGILILLGSSLFLYADIISIYETEFVGVEGETSPVTNYGWSVFSGTAFYGDASNPAKESLFSKAGAIAYKFADTYSFSVHGDIGATHQVDELWIHTTLMAGNGGGDVTFRLSFGNSELVDDSLLGKYAGIHMKTEVSASTYKEVSAIAQGYTVPTKITDQVYSYGDSGVYADVYIRVTDNGSQVISEVWLDPSDPENLGNPSSVKEALHKPEFSNIVDQIEINTWGGAPSFSRTGMLEVWAVFSNDPYGDWMKPYVGSLSSAEQERSADPDGDSMNNFMEYALGGNPTNDDASTVLPSLYINAEDAVYLYNRRTNHVDLGLSYYLELTSDLVSGVFSNDTASYVETGVSLPVNGFETVTNRILTTEDAKFFTLKVEE